MDSIYCNNMKYIASNQQPDSSIFYSQPNEILLISFDQKFVE